MKSYARSIVLATLCAACGSTSNSASGTVNGQGFSPSDSIFDTQTENSNGSNETILAVVLTSFSGACTYAQSPNAQNSNALPGTALELGIVADGNSIATGTTTVVDTENLAIARANDASTQLGVAFIADPNGTLTYATSGSITLNTLNGSSAEGTYSVTFASGSLSGSFNSSFCQLPSSTD